MEQTFITKSLEALKDSAEKATELEKTARTLKWKHLDAPVDVDFFKDTPDDAGKVSKTDIANGEESRIEKPDPTVYHSIDSHTEISKNAEQIIFEGEPFDPDNPVFEDAAESQGEKTRLSDLIKISDKYPDLDSPLLDAKLDYNRCPESNGHWDGKKGDSNWIPDDEYIPPDTPNKHNPDHLTWKELKEKYGFESIPFHDGEPDFSEISKGTVEIDDFSEDRDHNFDLATQKLAEQRGCDPDEVKKWMKENDYTWHECGDCKTMQKVPNEVHSHVEHSGGISEIKQKNKEGDQA